MTDEEKAAEVHAAAQAQVSADAEAQASKDANADPMEKAKANGYVEEPAPSRDERVKALIADVEHAMEHNAPMTPAIMAEMKALLQGE